jgi:hypothetical protein
VPRHPGQLAYGFARAMADDRRVDVVHVFGEHVEGARVVAKGIAVSSEMPDYGRPLEQRSTVFVILELPSGERRKLWIDEVDRLVVKGGPMRSEA